MVIMILLFALVIIAFMDYYLHNSDMTIESHSNKIEIHLTQTESFKVTLEATGSTTKIAGRLNGKIYARKSFCILKSVQYAGPLYYYYPYPDYEPFGVIL